jgi:hypothetical protein
VHSRTRRAHTKHVNAILQSIRGAQLRLNGVKCVFGMPKTTFVGFRISRNGINTEAKKVEAITSWPALASVGELRSYLGLVGYYRRFIEGFARKSAVLHNLVNACAGQAVTAFHRTAAHQKQFDAIKCALTTAPVLAIMDPNVEFILRTDASDYPIGVVLAQRQT